MAQATNGNEENEYRKQTWLLHQVTSGLVERIEGFKSTISRIEADLVGIGNKITALEIKQIEERNKVFQQLDRLDTRVGTLEKQEHPLSASEAEEIKAFLPELRDGVRRFKERSGKAGREFLEDDEILQIREILKEQKTSEDESLNFNRVLKITVVSTILSGLSFGVIIPILQRLIAGH